MNFFNPAAYQSLAQSIKVSPLLTPQPTAPVAPASSPALPDQSDEPRRRRRRSP